MILAKLFVVIAAEQQMSYFVAGLTNDDPRITAPVYKQYHHVQYNETLPASATVSMSFPPSSNTFRYVIIQQKSHQKTRICMAEVKVFLRGTVGLHCLLMSHYNDSVNQCSADAAESFQDIHILVFSDCR